MGPSRNEALSEDPLSSAAIQDGVQSHGDGSSRSARIAELTNQRKERAMQVLTVTSDHQLGEHGSADRPLRPQESGRALRCLQGRRAQISDLLHRRRGAARRLDPREREAEFSRPTSPVRLRKGSRRQRSASTARARLRAHQQETTTPSSHPGGHGPMWDLARRQTPSLEPSESFLVCKQDLRGVCHCTGALRHVKTPDGKLLVEGKTVTGFTNGEEG